MDTFGDNLRKRARELGLSDAEVARRAGLSPRRYRFYVTGDREPDLMTLLKIATVLNATTDQLLGKIGSTEQQSLRERTVDQLLTALRDLEPSDIALLAEVAAAPQRRRERDMG